jgi:glycosyltransferase involved in cell wall biosynthesis
MRILHILTSRAAGPREIYAAGVMAGLKEAGIAQDIVVAEDAAIGVDLARSGLVPAAKIPPAGFWKNWNFRRRLSRLKPDIIHCWTPQAVAFAPHAKAPLVGWGDDPQSLAPFRFVATTIEKDVNPLAKNNKSPKKIETIPFFTAGSSIPPIDRATVATPRDAKVLLSLARFHPHQNLDLLLEIAVALPDVYVWLAGEGPSRLELERRVHSLGLGERVRFLGSRTDHSALLRAANVLVAPASRDVYGLAILEAWAAGTPVIAAARGAAARLIEDGQNGLLFPAGDKKALLNAFNRLFSEPELRPRVVAQGYATYAKNHARAVVIRRWIDFYQRAAA